MAEIPPPIPTGEPSPLSAADVARLAPAVMRGQAALSVRVAVVFLIVILGLPLVNWLLPSVAEAHIGGFTLTWLVLGVLFYPLTWLISGYFVQASNRIEAEIAREHEGAVRGGASSNEAVR